MSPILGIYASSQQGTKLGNFYSIATTTLASATGTITFSSIPSTYSHLQIRYIARESVAAVNGSFNWTFNGSSASAYIRHYLGGTGTTTTAGGTSLSTAFVFSGQTTGSTALANTFGGGIIDIFDYANTNKNKTYKSLTGYDVNTAGYVGIESGLWINTAAINSISFVYSNFSQYTQFALYGVN